MAKRQDKTTTANPFEAEDHLSDLALVVEGQKLYVHKTHLALYSPVFRCMFYSPFVEKGSKEIELPGKSYQDVVEFLLQVYPVHALKPISDGNLLPLLSLAEEYQVEHIRQKCQKFIKDQLNFPYLTTDQLVLYLWMCDMCRFESEKKQFKGYLAQKTQKEITKSQFYGNVDSKLMRDVMYENSLIMRNRLNHFYDKCSVQERKQTHGEWHEHRKDSKRNKSLCQILLCGITFLEFILALVGLIMRNIFLITALCVLVLIVYFFWWIFFG